MALFMAEILYRSLKEEEGNPGLFHFLHQFVLFLDSKKIAYHHLHVFFLIELSRYLGFYPSNNYSGDTPYFDLVNGEFVTRKPVHNHYLAQPLTRTLHQLMHSAGNPVQVRDKFAFLEKIIDYYKLHLEGMGDIKSLAVLKDVFHDK
jgi:DNA repair protein RecO (recombination protein O)